MALGWTEMIALGLLAVMIFGKDLPRVARDTGRWLTEIRNSIRSIF